METNYQSEILGDHMTVDVTGTINQTVHPAFQLVRQHHVEALDILVSEYAHKVTGAVHYHLATSHDENVFLVAFRTNRWIQKVQHIFLSIRHCVVQRNFLYVIHSS